MLMGTFGLVQPFCPTPKNQSCLDRAMFKDVGMLDLRKKLFSDYPAARNSGIRIARAWLQDLMFYAWQTHCKGLIFLPKKDHRTLSPDYTKAPINDYDGHP